MAFSQWYSFNDKMVDYDRNQGAVYEFADISGNIIYIGSTNELQRRMKEHLSENAKGCIRTNASQYRYDYRSDFAAEEKRLYDSFVRANGRAPRCNSISP